MHVCKHSCRKGNGKLMRWASGWQSTCQACQNLGPQCGRQGPGHWRKHLKGRPALVGKDLCPECRCMRICVPLRPAVGLSAAVQSAQVHVGLVNLLAARSAAHLARVLQSFRQSLGTRLRMSSFTSACAKSAPATLRHSESGSPVTSVPAGAGQTISTKWRKAHLPHQGPYVASAAVA